MTTASGFTQADKPDAAEHARRIVYQFMVRHLIDETTLSTLLGMRSDRRIEDLAAKRAEEIRPELERLVRTYIESLGPIVADLERRVKLDDQLRDLVWDTTNSEDIDRLESLVAKLKDQRSLDNPAVTRNSLVT